MSIRVSVLKFALTLIAISGVFTLDVYLPGVPNCALTLSTNINNISFTFTFFAITFAVSQLIWGPLSDRYGRKPVLILGLSIAVITTILCGLATSYIELLVLRILQAVGVSCFVVLNAIIRDIHDGEIAVKWRAYLTAVSGASIATAPAFGSIAVKFFNWQGTYFLSAAVLFFTLITVVVLFQETCVRKPIRTKDVLKEYINLVTRYHAFNCHALQAALAYSVHFCFVILSSAIIVSQLRYSLLTYSTIMLMYGFSWLFSGIITSKLASRYSTNKIIYLGSTILFLGAMLLAISTLVTGLNIYNLMLSILIMVIGAMMVRPVVTTLSLSKVANISGQGSAMNNLIQFCVAGIAASLVSFYEYDAVIIISFYAIASVFLIGFIQHQSVKFLNKS